ncbi:Uncharacterized protein YxjI [Oscillospiraceae bacterium]|nr:Uncharacterized protein YxjI [Oscillospiraceae bacterium]
MKLYIKQKVFSLASRFNITDEDGNERYTVEGELLSLTRRLHIYDYRGEEVSLIHKELFTLMPRFVVERNGQVTATIKKRFTFLKPAYDIEGKGWHVEGDFFSHDYQIVDQSGEIIASIHKVWMSWGDSFELDLVSSEDEVDLIAVILAIDIVMDSESSSSSN